MRGILFDLANVVAGAPTLLEVPARNAGEHARRARTERVRVRRNPEGGRVPASAACPTTTATDEPLTNQHRRTLHADAAQASELSDHGTGFVRHSIFQHGITLLVEFGELHQD